MRWVIRNITRPAIARPACCGKTLAAALQALGIEVVPGAANFILCHLPESGPNAATVCRRCRTQDVFLRDAGGISERLGCARAAGCGQRPPEQLTNHRNPGVGNHNGVLKPRPLLAESA